MFSTGCSRASRRSTGFSQNQLLRGEPIADDVEEQRRCEGDGIQAVEHAAMALDHIAPVLGIEIALDGREHEAAEEAGDDDDGADGRSLQRRERRQACLLYTSDAADE